MFYRPINRRLMVAVGEWDQPMRIMPVAERDVMLPELRQPSIYFFRFFERLSRGTGNDEVFFRPIFRLSPTYYPGWIFYSDVIDPAELAEPDDYDQAVGQAQLKQNLVILTAGLRLVALGAGDVVVPPVQSHRLPPRLQALLTHKAMD